MIKKYIFSLLIVLTMAVTSAAHAQRSDSIAAVVNGDIITYTDLYDRMDLIMKSSGMPNTDEFKKKVMPQVLTGLITEQIQIQEAERLNLSISDEEIEKGFAELAAQNNMTADQFKTLLKRQKVAMNTLQEQIKSQLAWGKVIQQEIRPRVTLTDDDIEAELQRLRAREGQEEYLVAEIFLPVKENAKEAEAQKAVRDLARQLRTDPNSFPTAARQFSQSATAAKGGLIGWVTPDQLSEDVADTVKSMTPQTISDPIKTEDGYVIMFVREKRIIDLDDGKGEETLRIKAAIFTLPDNNEKDRKAVEDDAETLRQDVKGCLDIMKQVSRRQNADLRDFEGVKSTIPSNILEAVENTNIGDAGTIVKTEEAIIVPMLCGQGGGAKNAMLEREIENRLGTQRMDVLQKRYLRDLITEAYIERRV